MISLNRKRIHLVLFISLPMIGFKSLSFPGRSWPLLTTSVTPSPSPCSGTRCTGQSGTLTPSTKRKSSRGPTWRWWARLTVSTCRWWCRCTTPSVSRTTPTSAFPSTGTAVTSACRPRDTGTRPAGVRPHSSSTLTTGPVTRQVRESTTLSLISSPCHGTTDPLAGPQAQLQVGINFIFSISPIKCWELFIFEVKRCRSFKGSCIWIHWDCSFWNDKVSVSAKLNLSAPSYFIS